MTPEEEYSKWFANIMDDALFTALSEGLWDKDGKFIPKISKGDELMKKEFKGSLSFSHLDPHMARFHMEQVKGIISKAEVVFTPDLLPADFEVAKYDVRGAFQFVVEVKARE